MRRTNNLFRRKQKMAPQQESTITTTPEGEEEPAQVVIIGAGIVGLVLALALHKHCGIQVELYEQAQTFHDDVGAGMGMYPNGLRVIRDISPDLLEQIHLTGYPFVVRRWEVSQRKRLCSMKMKSPSCPSFALSHQISIFSFFITIFVETRWNRSSSGQRVGLVAGRRCIASGWHSSMEITETFI
jgi:hypothetical protein